VVADALILYGRAAALFPGDAEIEQAFARCRTESDRRAERSSRLRDLYTEALDAFAAGDLRRSRERLDEMLAIAPEDADGATMRARVETALAARVAELARRATAGADAGRFEEAESALAAARGLDAGAAAVTAASERLRRARRDAEVGTSSGNVAAQPAPVVAAPQLSVKRRREVADLYLRGVEAAEAGRADDAVRYWELVFSADPAHENVAGFLKREYLLRGLEAFSRGQLEDAVRTWERARAIDPSDGRVQGYLARASEQLARSRQILGESR
jgi:tetratricopeptide (TPR) repeat protein